MSEESQSVHSKVNGSGPLKGVTVLDITRVVAGPYCSMLLADLGATVIKIENPDDPDYTRTFAPFVQGETGEHSTFFAQFNHNKLGITLNLKSEKGKELLKALVRNADVLVENFRPGVMDKLGLGYDVLKQENPQLVYVGISGYGRVGPKASLPSFDSTAQAAGGLWSMNGFADRPPVRVGTIIGDISASLFATVGVLAALREAECSGIGQVVDISQQDSILALTEAAVIRCTVEQEIASPIGNDHATIYPYGQFPCKDGYVFYGGYLDKFWRRTCELFGEPDMADDPEIDTMDKRCQKEVYERRVRPLIERWFKDFTKAELEEMAGDRFPLTPIKDIQEVVEDPHILEREMVTAIPVADQMVRMHGLPVKLSATPGDPHAKAPDVGEHNELVYSQLAGVQVEEFDSLVRDKVI